MIRLREDGAGFEWVPPVPEDTLPSVIKVGDRFVPGPWAAFKAVRERYQWASPIRCIACGQQVSFFDAFDVITTGRRDRKDQVSRGTVVIGARIRMRVENRNPAHIGKTHRGLPLRMMSWMVTPQTLRGPGCKECQAYMITHDFIDMTQELLRRLV